MSDVMGTFGNMTLHAGPEAWVRCGTYTNGPLPNLSATDPARYAWEPVTPGDPDHIEHAWRLLHAVADRAR
jgi:hypothetical protein